jgi:hypothetical protein
MIIKQTRTPESRFAIGDRFQKAVWDELTSQGFHIALNGTEHTHPDFVGYIRLSEDATSLAIRFEPDGVMCYGEPARSWYVEAKASDKIEKTAYEQYMARHAIGWNIIIVFQVNGVMRWGFVQDITFIDSNAYVNAFPNPFPVKNGWITPRASRVWNYETRWNATQASGTPYRVINPLCLSGITALYNQLSRGND